MKLFLFLLLFTSTCLPQYFSSLRGMEDNAGNTHLFYKLSNEEDTLWNSRIYHLDINANSDTLFLEEYELPGMKVLINDFEFLGKDPAQYIYSRTEITTDTLTKIVKYNGDILFTHSGPGGNIEVSHQDINRIYAVIGNSTYKTTNGGVSWEELSFGRISSLSPKNHNVMFVFRNDSLYKSPDGGNIFYLTLIDQLNEGINSYSYYNDGSHLYRSVGEKDNEGYYFSNIYLSANSGEPFSWNGVHSTDHPVILAIDSITPGKSFLASGCSILVSYDYLSLLLPFRLLPRAANGLYVKPGSQKIYALTKRNLYEVRQDTQIVIKNMPIPSTVFSYYPLREGIKWVYNYYSFSWDPFFNEYNYDYSKEVTGDTLMGDGFKYIIIKIFQYGYTNYEYERADSSTGEIIKYSDIMSRTIYSLDLQPEEIFEYSWGKMQYVGDGVIDKWGLIKPIKKFKYLESLSYESYYLVKDIGLDSLRFGFDFGWGLISLKGMVVDGVVYGDTTITGIEDDGQIPGTYTLFQNYPNPFNPSTNIRFSIPERGIITIKIFDVLGRETAVLLNEERSAGTYEVVFNADKLSSGIYFCRMSSGGFTSTIKLQLIK